MATIDLKRDQLARFRRIAAVGDPAIQVDATFARRIGVHPGQVSRVLKGSAPGARFIAGCMQLFGPENFADLFVVHPDDNGEAA